MDSMKTEFTEVSETRKNISFEIPADAVEAEIARVAQGYSKSARVPGFRQGKVPSTVVRQRYKDQILYDVAHDLIPRLVGEALRERGLQPVATPDIKDVEIEEGQPLKFVADFEILPAIDPGDYTGISLRRQPAVLDVGAVDQTIERIRDRAGKWIPVEDRPAAAGDTLLLDLTRTPRGNLIVMPGDATPPPKPETLQNVTIEIGAAANPPGFDENLAGSLAGDQKAFAVTYPGDYEIKELAGTVVDYSASIKGVRRKELPPLDDDLAKEVSDLETLDALRGRIKEDLQKEAEHQSEHKVRHDLLQDLSGRMKVAPPDALVEHEVERRLEEFVRRLMEQGVDPQKAGIDWEDFRTRQRDAAIETVKSTLVLDEIARREHIETTDDDIAKEIDRFAERSGRTSAAIRARLEKEGGLERIGSGVRREKTMSWLLEKANIGNG
jgi:trigger factor